MKAKLTLILIAGIAINLLAHVYFYREQYLTKFDPVYWEGRYLRSQWVDPYSKESIGDDGLYAWAGWQYINGLNPILVNAEILPLGKYFIGLSIVALGNQNIQALFFAIGILIILYLIARQILNKNASLLTVFLFSLEPLFIKQIDKSLLDLPALFFLLASILLFIKFIKSSTWLSLAGSTFFLGMMMATKLYVSGLAFFIAYCLILLFSRKKRLLCRLLVASPILIVTFLLTYVVYFKYGYSLRDFLGLQKWIVIFHKNSLSFVLPGAPWTMMVFDRWENWFAGLWYRDHVIVSVPDWQITWPILAISLLIVSYKSFRKNITKGKNHFKTALAIMSLSYLLFLSFIPIFPRYLLLILPLMYILTVDLVLNSNLLGKIKLFIKKEIIIYRNFYLFFVALVLMVFVFKIPGINSEDFTFSPKIAHDLLLTRNVMFGVTPLQELPVSDILKVFFLTPLYFLTDANPKLLLIFLTFIPFILILVFYYLLRKNLHISRYYLTLVITGAFFISYWLIWDLPLLGSKNKDLIFKNEKEVLNFTYTDSEVFKFAILPLNESLNSDNYYFLYSWYETRLYRGKNVPLGDNEMHILYVIIKPNYKIDSGDKNKIAKDYNMKFRFQKQFSSGVIIWKFDRLPDDLGKLKT